MVAAKKVEVDKYARLLLYASYACASCYIDSFAIFTTMFTIFNTSAHRHATSNVTKTLYLYSYNITTQSVSDFTCFCNLVYFVNNNSYTRTLHQFFKSYHFESLSFLDSLGSRICCYTACVPFVFNLVFPPSACVFWPLLFKNC